MNKNALTKLQTRQLKVLDETAAFYRADPKRRAYNQESGNCEYISKDGLRRCALGRLLPKNLCLRFMKGGNNGVMDFSSQRLKLMPKSVISLGVKFLSNLQSFHDDEKMWNKKGWTLLGRDEYKAIKQNILDNKYAE